MDNYNWCCTECDFEVNQKTFDIMVQDVFIKFDSKNYKFDCPFCTKGSIEFTEAKTRITYPTTIL